MLTFVQLAISFKLIQRISFRHLTANEFFFLSSQLLHLLLNGRQITFFDNHAIFWHHIVEETVFYSWTESKLNARI